MSIVDMINRALGDPKSRRRVARKGRKWIQKATKKGKGKLKTWAKGKGFLNKDGTVDLRRAAAYAERHELTKRIREVNLAKTLRRLRK